MTQSKQTLMVLLQTLLVNRRSMETQDFCYKLVHTAARLWRTLYESRNFTDKPQWSANFFLNVDHTGQPQKSKHFS